MDYSITKVMILTIILLNKTLFEAKWKCHLLETMAQKATFDFSVPSVVCDPGQSTERFSLPRKERKLVPPFLAWLMTALSAVMQSCKRWTITHLRNVSPDLSLYTSALVLLLKESIFWNAKKWKCPVYCCSHYYLIGLSGSCTDSLYSK